MISSRKNIVPRLAVWAPAFGEGGGIQAFSGEVAKAFDELQPNLLARTAAKRFERPIQCPRQSLPALSQRFGLLLMRHALLARPGLIVSTHLNFGPLALLIQKTLKTPYILVAHGIDVAENLSRFRVQALQQANRIVAVSDHTRQRLLALGGIRSSQIEVIPNTVDHVRFSPGPRDHTLFDRYQIPNDRQIILTVGRLSAEEAYKGYDQIIRAMPSILRQCDKAHYLIVGHGGDMQRIRSLVESVGLKNHVTFAGFVPNHELAEHYRLANVFAMPSTGEGFGIVYLEAMACGVPVLAGNCDGAVDALANGELGVLVDPRSVEHIADGLVRLLTKCGPEFWFQPENLREQMLAKFSRSVFRKRWQNLVRSVVPGIAPRSLDSALNERVGIDASRHETD